MDGELMRIVIEDRRGKHKKKHRSGGGDHEPGLLEMFSGGSGGEPGGIGNMGSSNFSTSEFEDAGRGLRAMTDATSNFLNRGKKKKKNSGRGLFDII